MTLLTQRDQVTGKLVSQVRVPVPMVPYRVLTVVMKADAMNISVRTYYRCHKDIREGRWK